MKETEQHKQKERYTVFLDWKKSYFQNGHTNQGNLQIQCKPYQNTNGIFHRTRINNLKNCMETQKTQIAKTVVRKKNRDGGIMCPHFRLHYKAPVIKTV